ncbi:hypothetical protein DERF_010498 [Dermatophagoides farinae]|uniref:Uncharacterized protein n=1 Tax=Dermatophagoides farinae TaxID=6954 RepID=A0A922L3L3_DERFA|nr:hypothetical protein DERF_010498 [Dermatophagoides farinae]
MKFLFLTFKTSNQTTSPSDIMQKAFISIQKRNYTSRLINFQMMKSTSDVLHLSNQQSYHLFDCFHNKNQCHIIGPLVITYCDDEFCPFSHCSLPKRTWPIYSLCMRGLEVTISPHANR